MKSTVKTELYCPLFSRLSLLFSPNWGRCLVLFLCLTIYPGQAAWAGAKVLFDQGHSQAFLIENSGELDLSNFADLFRDAGIQVESSRGPINKSSLQGVDCLIISGPFSPLQPNEILSVLEFVGGGGKLVVMLHIAQPLAPVMLELGVVHSNGVIREQNNLINGKVTDFSAATSGEHPLTTDLHDFSLYGAWALAGSRDGVKELAATTEHAWVDLNKDGLLGTGDAIQKLAVVVSGLQGDGEFLVFGDDAIFQNRFLVDNNAQLARNLAVWIGHNKNKEGM